jgi:hypothetical protein
MLTVRDPSIPIDEYGFRRPRRRHPAQPHRGGIDGRHHEFYDFYVYATAAVSVFPQLFFPRSSPTTALPRRWRRSVWRSWRGK